jgi:hypothetical protein
MEKKKLKEGWGRSIVNGKEVLTPPSQKAESAEEPRSRLADAMDEMMNEAERDPEKHARELAKMVPRLSKPTVIKAEPIDIYADDDDSPGARRSRMARALIQNSQHARKK